MDDLAQSRFASTLALIIGIWVIVSSVWLPMSTNARMSTLVVGIVMVVMSIAQYFVRNSTPSLVNGFAAVWLVVSVFLYGMMAAAAWSAVIAAASVFILSWWDGVEIESYRHHHLAP